MLEGCNVGSDNGNPDGSDVGEEEDGLLVGLEVGGFDP